MTSNGYYYSGGGAGGVGFGTGGGDYGSYGSYGTGGDSGGGGNATAGFYTLQLGDYSSSPTAYGGGYSAYSTSTGYGGGGYSGPEQNFQFCAGLEDPGAIAFAENFPATAIYPGEVFNFGFTSMYNGVGINLSDGTVFIDPNVGQGLSPVNKQSFIASTINALYEMNAIGSLSLDKIAALLNALGSDHTGVSPDALNALEAPIYEITQALTRAEQGTATNADWVQIASNSDNLQGLIAQNNSSNPTSPFGSIFYSVLLYEENGAMPDGAVKPPATVAYYPGGNSGLTIATGDDLSWTTADQLIADGMDPAWVASISRFLDSNGQRGLYGQDLQNFLNANPGVANSITISMPQANAIDDGSLNSIEQQVATNWNNADQTVKFANLSQYARTAIVSAAYQMGPNEYNGKGIETTQFWADATVNNWDAAFLDLISMALSNQYTDRRLTESSLILNSPELQNQ